MTPRTCSRAFHARPAQGEAPAYGRWREPQGGHQQPGAVLRAEAEVGRQDPRGARGAAEVVRGAQPGVQGPAPGRLGARDFFEAAEGEAGSARRGGEAEDPGRAGRQVRAVRLRADGHLRAGPRGAGEAGLCGQRADFAGAVRCHSEKTLRESAQPTSLESRVAPGVMEYIRSPKLPPLVFEAQTCAKDALYVGVDVVRCRRNGLANAPFPLPILCPADGVEPVDGVLPDLGFVEGCCDAWQSCLNLLPYVGAGPGRLPLGPHRVGQRSHVDADAAARAGAHGRRVAGRGAHGQAQRERDDRPVGAQHGGGLQRAQQQQAFAYEGGMVWDFVYARRLLSNGTYRPIHDAVLARPGASWTRRRATWRR